jgi:hypothetical protein
VYSLLVVVGIVILVEPSMDVVDTTFHIARSIEKCSGAGMKFTKLYITASNGKVSESF